MITLLTKICGLIITYSFYALFLLVPLTFTSNTFELFEFNKMWLTFGLTILIIGSWLVKMALKKRFFIQRTPLDIPILLFLLSQIIATFHSLDTHVSLWGYYSRFNGGLISIIAYILLYYAFVSNFGSSKSNETQNPTQSKDLQQNSGSQIVKMTKRLLLFSLISCAVVALWGFPSHFGYDPTCLMFRGTLDVSCWTDAFQPKVRIFSTLGQPNWLAAYLAALLPLSLAFLLNQFFAKKTLSKLTLSSILLAALLYVDIIFTASRSGFLALIAALFVFFVIFAIKKLQFIQTNARLFSVIAILTIVISLFAGTPFTPKITNLLKTAPQNTKPVVQGPALETGGTESSEIRKIVWKGAIDIWKAHPLFGTGVETYAFAYYQYRPAAHNLTSEWDYLYNKAHNEYLNYLATTGAFGLGTYILLIAWFFYITLRYLLFSDKDKQSFFLVLALFTGYLSILISNFFGFSVVIINIFFFLIPAFVLVLTDQLSPRYLLSYPKAPSTFPMQKNQKQNSTIFFAQAILIFVILTTTAILLAFLIRFWIGDTEYASGYNLDRATEYSNAYPHLVNAVSLRPSEPAFLDELSINTAILAEEFALQKQATTSAILAKNAIQESNVIVATHPNNVVYWKTRVRVFYALSQVDPSFLSLALDAIKKAHALAPTDAKVSYNLGLLYGQNNEPVNAIKTLEETIQLKPDYKDAYYALGLYYHEQALGKNGKVADKGLEQKAVDTMHYVLDHFSKNDPDALKSLKDWGELPVPNTR